MVQTQDKEPTSKEVVSRKSQVVSRITLIYIPANDTPSGTLNSTVDSAPVRQFEVMVMIGRDSYSRPQFRSLNLIPGTNTGIDHQLWEEAKKLPLVQYRIKRHAIMELIPTNPNAPDSEKERSCIAYSATDAEVMITNVWDRDILERWRRWEDRPDVDAAIASRIEELTEVHG